MSNGFGLGMIFLFVQIFVEHFDTNNKIVSLRESRIQVKFPLFRCRILISDSEVGR